LLSLQIAGESGTILEVSPGKGESAKPELREEGMLLRRALPKPKSDATPLFPQPSPQREWD
jgi:hypothetical protein